MVSNAGAATNSRAGSGAVAMLVIRDRQIS